MQDNEQTQIDQLGLDPELTETSEVSRPNVVETAIHPKQPLHFGTHISISIEESSIAMAAVLHAGHFRKIKDLSKHYVTPESHRPSERVTFITKEINDFLKKHKGPFSIVSLAISGRETALRSFLMPILKKNDLDAAIEIEAKKQLPFPIDECTFDYRPISKIKTDDRELYNISLLAATRRLTNEKLALFGERKKFVEHIYHAPDIVGRLLPFLENFEDFGAYTTLNIGQQQSELAFYRGNSLEFYSVISVGAAMLGKTPDSVSFAFLAESLATEIQTSIDFYTGRFGRASSSTILVYGDLAYSDEVISGLKSSSGYKFERFPINKLKFVSKKDLDLFKAEIPVCLPAFAAAACPAGMADVLPREAKQVHSTFRILNYAKASMLVLAFILVASWGLFTQAISIRQSELVSLNTRVNDFVNSEAYRTYNLVKRQIAIDQAYLKSAVETPTFLSLNLKELSSITPKQVRLLHMQYRPNDPDQNLILQGRVYSEDIPPEVVLAEFIENMSLSPFYKSVEISKHVKREYDDGFEIDFAIKCQGII